MRISRLLIGPLLGGIVALSACAPGYGRGGASIGIGGPGIDIWGYSAERWGDWHTSYRNWRPTTVYEVNGAYYPHNVRGARPVQVYSANHEYFMPPHEQAWVGADKRFNVKRQPTEEDYGRARPRP